MSECTVENPGTDNRSSHHCQSPEHLWKVHTVKFSVLWHPQSIFPPETYLAKKRCLQSKSALKHMSCFRHQFPHIRVIPKQHLLEAHCVPVIVKWGVGRALLWEKGERRHMPQWTLSKGEHRDWSMLRTDQESWWVSTEQPSLLICITFIHVQGRNESRDTCCCWLRSSE